MSNQTPADCVLAAAAADPANAARQLDLRPHCVANLVRLARYLRALPQDYGSFDMSGYYGSGEDNPAELDNPRPNECGTVACAVGHGPAAGIEPLPGEDWPAYEDRVFVARADGSGYNGALWAFLFSGQWEALDNTARGAAARICYALQHGVPEGSDAAKVRAYQQYLD